jgi:hypothetical protein
VHEAGARKTHHSNVDWHAPLSIKFFNTTRKSQNTKTRRKNINAPDMRDKNTADSLFRGILQSTSSKRAVLSLQNDYYTTNKGYKINERKPKARTS